MSNAPNLQKAAEWYAQRRWPVIPLHSVRKNGSGLRCSCRETDCSSPAKHPRTPHGLKDATIDSEMIAQSWRDWPSANVGIRTGSAPVGAGILVLDIDPRHAGDQSLTALIRQFGELPATIEAVTGGGGRHIVLAHPGGVIRNRTGVRPGIDVRGDNGYIVVAPSSHISGHRYCWRPGQSPRDIEPATAPRWLIEIVREETCPGHPERTASTAIESDLIDAASRYVTTVEPVAEGERNAVAFKLAGHLLAFTVEDTGETLSEAQVLGLLGPWNQRNLPPLPQPELAGLVGSAKHNGSPRAPHLVKRRPSHSALSANSARSGEWQDPAPLRDARPPTPFPIDDAFPGALTPVRDFIAAVAEASQVAIDMPAMLLLPVGATCIAQKLEIATAPGHSEPAALWTVILLESGNRKSNATRTMTAPLSRWERDETDRLGPIIAAQHEHRKMDEARLKYLRQQASKATGDKYVGLVAEAESLAQQIAAESIETAPQLITTEPTTEAVGKMLEANHERLLVASAEADSLDVMLGRYNRGMPNFGVYLCGHAGDPYRIDRSGRPPTHLNRPTLSVTLAVQPDAMIDVFANRQARGRGLLARFLYSLPESLLGHRKTNPPPVPEGLKLTYDCMLRRLLDVEMPSEPSIVEMDDEAAELFLGFVEWLEPELGEGGELSDRTAWAGKLAGAVGRIALVLYGLEWGLNSVQPAAIDAVTMHAALAWAPYLIAHQRRAEVMVGTDPETAGAERVLKWLRRTGKETFSARDAFTECRSQAMRRMDDFRPALELLVETGHIRPIEVPKHLDPGRKPSPTFAVNPRWQRSCSS